MLALLVLIHSDSVASDVDMLHTNNHYSESAFKHSVCNILISSYIINTVSGHSATVGQTMNWRRFSFTQACLSSHLPVKHSHDFIGVVYKSTTSCSKAFQSLKLMLFSVDHVPEEK